MKYIILAAGRGTRLHPLTLNYPKCLFKLDDNSTVIQRMINTIRKHDKKAQIVTVLGFMRSAIEKTITGTDFIYNPFFDKTNSVASLWFAKEHLDDEVVIINGDVIMEPSLIKNIVVKSFDYPFVLVDSSMQVDGDYNVQVHNDKIIIMSKELKNYYGEYAGVSKLDKATSILLKTEVEKMLEDGNYDQWYENALVQLIFNNSMVLQYKDISEYEWTEIDCVDDLQKAKAISKKSL